MWRLPDRYNSLRRRGDTPQTAERIIFFTQIMWRLLQDGKMLDTNELEFTKGNANFKYCHKEIYSPCLE